MKRIVICCDGTWNSPDQCDENGPCPTNVTNVALWIADQDDQGVRQLVFYDKGVGTNRCTRALGGMFGYGLSKNVKQAYRFLVTHYEPGDEVYYFGFSRGAYTVRSTAGFICNCGLLRPEHADRLSAAYKLYRRRDNESHPAGTEATLFKKTFSHEVSAHFIGVWDTVGALGIPLWWGVPYGWLKPLRQKWQFHDVDISSSVGYAYQALAIDEQRRPFEPSIWRQSEKGIAKKQVLEQQWFPGVHSNVGGGYPDARLSNIALQWIKSKAVKIGLKFETSLDASDTSPGHTGKLENSLSRPYRLLGRHIRPIASPCPDDAEAGKSTNESINPSALDRMKENMEPPYQPQNLVDFLNRRPRPNRENDPDRVPGSSSP
jgi:uncharacterized protein (DUF2235 family)